MSTWKGLCYITGFDEADVNGENNISQQWHFNDEKPRFLWPRIFSSHVRCLQGPFVSSSILCQFRESNNVYTEVAKFSLDRFWLDRTKHWHPSHLDFFIWPLDLKLCTQSFKKSSHVHRIIEVVAGVTTVCKDQVLYCHYTIA